MALISIESVSKTYELGEILIRALRDFDLAIENGEYVAILGPSGSVKSTLMNLIGCLDRPSAGRYMLDGVNVGELSENRLAEIWYRSALMLTLRREIPDHLKGVCGLCVLKTVCQGECRAQAYERTHDLMGPYWICQEAYEAGLFPESRLISPEAESRAAAVGLRR